MARKAKKNSYEVDFTGVEGRTSCPEGEGRFKVTSVEFVDNDNEGAFQWKFDITDFEADDPKAKAPKTFSDRTGLATNQLWNLRNRLEALGAEVPDGPLEVDFDELVGLELIARVKHTSNGDKTYQNLTDYMPADGEASESDSSDEDEEEVKVTKKKKARDEDEEEEDEKPVKKKRATRDDDEEEEAPKKKSKRAESEEDEEEEEKPVKKKKKPVDEDEEEEEAPKKKSKVKKYSTDDIRDHDEDGLQELIDKHSLDVDLDDHSNLRKKAMAVADALDEQGLLED